MATTIYSNSIAITKAPKAGDAPVSCFLSKELFLLPSDEWGDVSTSEYENIQIVVSLAQSVNGEYKLLANSSDTSENGTFTLTASCLDLSFYSVSGSLFKASASSRLAKDSTFVVLTISYRDFFGSTGEFVKNVPLVKVKKGNDGTYKIRQYCLSDNLETLPSSPSWQDTIPVSETNFLWYREKNIEPGTDPSTVDWGTPSPVLELTYSVGGSAIKLGNKKVSFYADSSYFDGDATIVGALDVRSIFSHDIQIEGVKDTNGNYVSLGTIRSAGYEKNTIDSENPKQGFYMDTAGYMEAVQARFKGLVANGATILDGVFDAVAMKTVNEETPGSWCATVGYVDTNGNFSHPVTIAIEKDGATQIKTVGTFTHSDSSLNYYRGSDLLNWLRNNIPINNTGFTQLSGKILGYQAYALRFSENYWSKDQVDGHIHFGSDSTSEDYSGNTSFDCGSYYRKFYMTFELYCPSSGSYAIVSSFNLSVDGIALASNLLLQVDEGETLEKVCFSPITLSPGSHTIQYSYHIGLVRWARVREYAISSVTDYYASVYNSNYIQLRLYSNDASNVFTEGSSSNKLNICTFGAEIGNMTYKNTVLSVLDAPASSQYFRNTINLSYGSASLKCGKDITEQWTITRYNKFKGLYEVGKKNDNGEIVWQTSPTLRAPCQQKVKSVTIGGVQYTQNFVLIWDGTNFSLTAYDGSRRVALSTNRFYTESEMPFVAYAEVPTAAGLYTANIYPQTGFASEVGSASQPFECIYPKTLDFAGAPGGQGQLFNLFPIGSTYVTTGNESPDDILGGDWELISTNITLTGYTAKVYRRDS